MQYIANNNPPDNGVEEISLDQSFQGTWRRTDLANGNCESLDLTQSGQSGPHSQAATYNMTGVTIHYGWRKFITNTTCNNDAFDYFDQMNLVIESINDNNGLTEITARVTSLTRTVLTTTAPAFLNGANGEDPSCGLSNWSPGNVYNYKEGNFICTDDNRDFTFKDNVVVGDVVYLTLKRNSDSLDLQLSLDQNNLGAIQIYPVFLSLN